MLFRSEAELNKVASDFAATVTPAEPAAEAPAAVPVELPPLTEPPAVAEAAPAVAQQAPPASQMELGLDAAAPAHATLHKPS